MANLWVTEYGGYAPGPSQVAMTPKLTSYVVAISTVAAVSTVAFGPATNYVRLNTDVGCHLSFVTSTGVTLASTLDPRLPADGIEYFGVQSGRYISVVST
jgi:hypothetical protein